MIVKIAAEFIADVGNDTDLNTLWMEFESGLTPAVAHFPGGDVFEASVEDIVKATPEEIAERGWEDE